MGPPLVSFLNGMRTAFGKLDTRYCMNHVMRWLSLVKERPSFVGLCIAYSPVTLAGLVHWASTGWLWLMPTENIILSTWLFGFPSTIMDIHVEHTYLLSLRLFCLSTDQVFGIEKSFSSLMYPTILLTGCSSSIVSRNIVINYPLPSISAG